MWVNIIKIKKINRIFESGTFDEKDLDGSEKITVSRKKFITKTVNDENIDDKEEYLNIKDTIIQVNINKKHNWKDRAVITPKYVATPFPPSNLSHTGNICPRKDIIADK